MAVDVPFGWPKPLIEALKSYKVGRALDRDRRRYLYRVTDTFVTETLPQRLPREVRPPNPLPVAADKLGGTAMVGTVLLNALSSEFQLSPRENYTRPAVIEVYPAASLWAWSLPYNGYKRGDNASTVRLEILRSLERAFKLRTQGYERLLLGSDHCLDALVAALTAQEYANGNTFDPPEHISEETLRVEGWIRTPNRSIEGAFGK